MGGGASYPTLWGRWGCPEGLGGDQEEGKEHMVRVRQAYSPFSVSAGNDCSLQQ
jgi:hypothetical protein